MPDCKTETELNKKKEQAVDMIKRNWKVLSDTAYGLMDSLMEIWGFEQENDAARDNFFDYFMDEISKKEMLKNTYKNKKEEEDLFKSLGEGNELRTSKRS